MIEITKAQEEILRILWKINDGAVSDIIDHLPEPKPAHTTVATVIKVLEKKGYVSYKKYGKTYVYFPVVSKKDYAQYILGNSFSGLFNNSFNQIMSFFVKQNDVGLNELEELKQLVKKEIQKQKK